MKCMKQWCCALTVALAGALSSQAIAQQTNFGSPVDATTSVVRLATATASWNATSEAPPEPPLPEAPQPPAPEATAPGNVVGDAKASTNCTTGCATGCATCGQTCCECAPEYSWIASAEATFLWPQFNRNFLTADVASTNGGGNFTSNAALSSVDGSLLVAPRLTLGVQGCCWGLVGRYWYASNWATGYTPSDPALAPAGIEPFDNFRAYTVDLELQRKLCVGAWNAYGFGGVRYAQVDNDRLLHATAGTFGETALANSFSSQQFAGTGLTFGFWAIRPICCDSPLKYFVANRYSFIWGNGSAAAETNATAIDTSGASTSTNGALTGGNGDLFIGEIQLGLQWDAQLRCFPGRAFVRTALEYQYWDTNVGLNTGVFSVASAGPVSASATSSAGDLLFDLIGFNLGVGIMY